MSNRQRYNRFFLLFGFTAFAGSPSYAGIVLGLGTGSSELSGSRYDSAYSTRLTAGYGSGSVGVRVSSYDFQEFSLTGNSEASFELSGTSVEAFWTVKAGLVNVDLGGGLFDWEGKTKLDGRVFGREYEPWHWCYKGKYEHRI